MKSKRLIALLLAALLIFTAGCSLPQNEITKQITDELTEELTDTVLRIADELLEEPDGSASAPKQSAQQPPKAEKVESPKGEPAPKTEASEGGAAPKSAQPEAENPEETEQKEELPDEDGVYDSKDEVALYIHCYGHLPKNYVKKSKAQDAGWSGGPVWKYLPGKCIGGDRFGNKEGLLPSAKGRTWTECDIDTLDASSRGAKRIVFSNDGLIYYTEDHYESFEKLY